MKQPVLRYAVFALATAVPAVAAAETLVAAIGEDGLALRVACPQAPHRAVLSGYPAPLPEPRRARLFRYRLDGAAPAIGMLEAAGDGVVLRFPSGDWLNADRVEALLPAAWQRLAFAPSPGAAAACGAAAAKPEKRARIAAIQAGLAAHGLSPGRMDGVFDAATGAAIVAWQRYFGLLPDGAPSPALRARLAATSPDGLGVPARRALAARIARLWRPPGWARGAYSLTAPLRLRLDARGAVTHAAVETGPGGRSDGFADRVARTAAGAALAVGRLTDDPGAPRDLLLHVTLPVDAAGRAYAGALARRLARHRVFPTAPPAAAGGRAALLRLHIDGAAKTVRTDILDPGALSSAQLAGVRAAVARLPRIPPPPADGEPPVFAVDLTLFARAPYVVAGRAAFADWPEERDRSAGDCGAAPQVARWRARIRGDQPCLP